MTPTLLGRWQTRLFLIAVVGIPVTLGFCFLFADFVTPLALLGYMLVLGLFWDILYDWGQTRRWDRDWPPVFMAIGGLFEGLLLWGLVQAGLPNVSAGLTLGQFAAHYATLFTINFLLMLSLLKVIFPKWRFSGGEFF